MKSITLVGAGLAGLSLGNTLQRAGVPVILHEAHTLPRHRVCGEFICGKGAASLERQGLGAAIQGALEHRSIQWFMQERPILASQLPSPAYGISRYTTDLRLAKSFRRLGGQLIEQSRFSSTAEEGKVNCSGRSTTKSDWIGLKLHTTNLVTSADLELHLGNQGYIGLSGIEDGRTNICALFKLRPEIRAHKEIVLLQYLRACGLMTLADRIEASAIDPSSHVGVAGINFSQIPDASSSGLHLGDAYSVIPPFTGNGMSIAIESAEIAFPYLHDYAKGDIVWQQATDQIQQACRRQFYTRLTVARALHPWIESPARQQILARLSAAKVLPFKLLYHLTH
ncbi:MULTISPECIES: NAD(P)/FAD-dependent oxidoreductase [unclassified Lentimonas]|uniref:NAD(P)/FAD-dependent oxidoreductase n=1 Tax=unclassified Lentimonas TaxID=2630993 RepID=UPI00132B4ACC|nr:MULTISPECIES: hypothetical protein [unclassified Lentimonas]CAA6679198.1 Unannotated [Lentimonas sp. CC4]CAA6684058.1 Unannotated [Lentimonas sp. CC6]CAA7076566.1 Unannotated [Lentimonas sp. CC4]CAA7171660.1 Unannotated [Lentimonas sp. CC21]CAA7183037.1 Unannotated [Lentimonas sp. CC8]